MQTAKQTAGDSEAAESRGWNVFLCYRQVDGGETAEWLYQHLDNHPLPTGEETAPTLSLYFDQTAAAVSNWHELHQPALEKARAMIVVCTPGAAMDEGHRDWVQQEIAWWVKNRKAAPILVDATGVGERYVPKRISARWPDAQRVTVEVGALRDLPQAKREAAAERLVSRIVGGIVHSESRVRDQELERRRRRQRQLVAALLVAVVSVAVAGWKWVESARSLGSAELARLEAEAALEREQQAHDQTELERIKKTKALDEVARLSDSKVARDLVREVDDLWPLHPRTGPAMLDWIERTKKLLENRLLHENALAALRGQALPYTDEDRERDHAENRAQLASLQESIRGAVAEQAGLEDKEDEASTRTRKLVAEQIENLKTRVTEVETLLKEQLSWRFGDPRDAWIHETVSDLLKDMESLHPAGGRGGLLQVLQERHAFVSSLRRRSVEDHAVNWQQTIEAIAASPKYGGLRIAPQLGLIPLGPDPDSGLFEFAHIGSGTLARREPKSNRLVLHEDAAIVLALIPGRTFHMGAQKDKPEAPNYDPQAEGHESPVHVVTLSPYLISKYELTQAQWAEMTRGQDPSRFEAGGVYGDRRATRRNPVEQVSWEECDRWLRRNSLVLPSEAQWEHACRAGTDTPWMSGRDVASLSKVANIADAYFTTHGGMDVTFTPEVNDGHTASAPVGSLAPNAFGLYDMHGNVMEWCLDTAIRYHPARMTDPVAAGSGERVCRGGSWYSVASYARCSCRIGFSPRHRHHNIGLRPARTMTSD